MRARLALSLALVATACATPQPPFDLARFQTPSPELGLSRGPDGWYLSRLDGPFGTDASSRIWRYPFDGGEAIEVTAFNTLGESVSDFSYDPASRKALLVVDGDIFTVGWTEDGNWYSYGPMLPWNTPGYEASPQLVGDDIVYFASVREGGLGQGDIYSAAFEGNEIVIKNVGPAINSATGEWNLAVSPDRTMMVFEASGRPANMSPSGDLYLSCRVNGEWQPAKPMAGLNTEGSELDFRFLTNRTGVFSTATIGGDAVLRFAGAHHFADCD